MFFRPFFLVVVSILLAAFPSARAESRLERTNLFQFHDANGKVVQGKSKRDWLNRRKEILLSMQEVMGKLPGKEKRCALDMRVEEEVDCGAYIRKSISYQSEPGNRVPAFLLIPKKILLNNAKARAVLCLHPTDAKSGNKTVVGLTTKENRSYASELAERGFVTLAPSYLLLADYNPDWRKLGYESGTMKAIWDNVRGIDLLESLPFVKRGGVAAIGHSLGGHNSIYTAVFDERIKVIVSSCGFDSYLDYMNGNIKGWTSDRYMPKLLDYSLEEIPFDFHEMIAALAPRPVFVNAPKADANFNWQSVDRVIAAAETVYQIYGATEEIHVEHPNCAHDFPVEIREKAYRFIEQQLP